MAPETISSGFTIFRLTAEIKNQISRDQFSGIYGFMTHVPSAEFFLVLVTLSHPIARPLERFKKKKCKAPTHDKHTSGTD